MFKFIRKIIGWVILGGFFLILIMLLTKDFTSNVVEAALPKVGEVTTTAKVDTFEVREALDVVLVKAPNVVTGRATIPFEAPDIVKDTWFDYSTESYITVQAYVMVEGRLDYKKLRWEENDSIVTFYPPHPFLTVILDLENPGSKVLPEYTDKRILDLYNAGTGGDSITLNFEARAWEEAVKEARNEAHKNGILTKTEERVKAILPKLKSVGDKKVEIFFENPSSTEEDTKLVFKPHNVR